MSATNRATIGGDRERIATSLRRALADWRPPLRRREFWAVEGLVVLLAAGHALIEASGALGDHSSLTFLPPALFFIPVAYSAVHFGLRGSLLTALWCSLLVVPNIFLWHSGLEALGEGAQLVWVVLVAVFVGVEVDRERAARIEAEDRERAERLSEARYRAIFDASAEPILVLDPAWRVEAANPAAARLFGQSIEGLRGRELPGGLGQATNTFMATHATDGQPGPPIRVPSAERGRLDGTRWVQPMAMAVAGPDGRLRTQLMLIDVTAGHERERGLEEIARQTMKAREEEGRRIARELHDGPVQSLVALWRRLDELEDEVAPEQASTVRQARAIAQGVAGELRRVSRSLRPSVLDDLGLTAALQAEANASAERSGLCAEITVFGAERPLDPSVELALLRIGQEALHNTERHAAASRVAMLLDFGTTDVSLAVDDDGSGLDPIPPVSGLLASDHLGLIGMRERARLVDGELSLGPSALGGLRLEVRIPIATLSLGDA